MNPELIEEITRLVVEKLQSQPSSLVSTTEAAKSANRGVKFWNHTSSSSNCHVDSSLPIEMLESSVVDSEQALVKFRKHNDMKQSNPVISQATMQQKEKKPVKSGEKITGVRNPVNKEELEILMSKTPSRIGIGRAGLRPRTDTWLKFRFDHAAAVDAVYGDVNDELLNRLDLFKVNTKVTDKEVYIRRPDYGRKLSDEAKKMIEQRCEKAPTVQVIVSDGLSSKAIDANLEDVYLSLQQSLRSAGLNMGTPFYIEKGRVAVMDDVGELLQPKVVILLIGERPGLISAESLSAYLCYEPRRGTIEAERMVVSNIHKGGIPPVEAGAYLGTVIQKVLKYEASGVSLVKKER
ncbi:ethanolamine ammonia-lyase subunit EutC [Peribacillus asahii]|uniref:ethanolamine ammonia-lyase subunit EutC n=1 Tax=Peribacillus asahii TaxID=228899 RepID=UPI0038005BED